MQTNRNFFKEMTSQQKTLSTGIFTLMLLVILIWGSLKPTILTIIETRKKLADRKQTLKQLQDKSLKINELATDLRSINPQLEKIDYYYPYNEDYSLLIDNLDKILQHYNYSLKSINFRYKTSQKIPFSDLRVRYLNPVVFTIQIEGSPQNLNGFLNYFESTPFCPQIISISLKNPKTDTPQNIAITFVVYKLKYRLFYEN